MNADNKALRNLSQNYDELRKRVECLEQGIAPNEAKFATHEEMGAFRKWVEKRVGIAQADDREESVAVAGVAPEDVRAMIGAAVDSVSNRIGAVEATCGNLLVGFVQKVTDKGLPYVEITVGGEPAHWLYVDAKGKLTLTRAT